MGKIDLSFIKKTGISAEIIPDGLGNKKRNKCEFHQMPKYFDDLSKVIKSSYHGNYVIRYDYYLNYKYRFDYDTGLYQRTDYLDENFNETGKDVFAANFPHLIDVGIMGHCTHGLSGKCMESGVECYQSGLNVIEPNMTLEDFTKLAKECNGYCNQFALGGRGDPNEHEHFEEILKICRDNHIVPNYTTSGFNLTDEQIALSKKYCGAVAISWYRSDYTLSSIKRLVDAGVKTNIHYVLNTETLYEAVDLFEHDKFPEGINAVIFLSHKPMGLGQKDKCLNVDNPLLQRLFYLIKNKKRRFKVGVDGSLVVGMIGSNYDFNMKYLDTCEAGRFTCYIDAKLHMKPCSFDVTDKYAVDISKTSIAQGWNSETFQKVRQILSKGCPGCPKNDMCHGGCVLTTDITLCSFRDNYKI